MPQSRRALCPQKWKTRHFVSRRVDVLIVGMKCIVRNLGLNMQQLTRQTNFAPFLKSAWHKSAWGMEWVALKDGVGWYFSILRLKPQLQESFGRNKMAQWNDLTLKGIANHKLLARNVQGPPTECLTVRFDSSWTKCIETWRMLRFAKMNEKCSQGFRQLQVDLCQCKWPFQISS